MCDLLSQKSKKYRSKQNGSQHKIQDFKVNINGICMEVELVSHWQLMKMTRGEDD